MNHRVSADLRAAVRERRSVPEELSPDLHGTPETRFEEHHAVGHLVGPLAVEGFEVNKRVAGLPTAALGPDLLGDPELVTAAHTEFHASASSPAPDQEPS
jgi:metal-dependent amidase/aminoacylase/carboxypeptidase family protein